MGTVITFANQQGGVGKTTLATQFAYFLRLERQAKVLFLDLDFHSYATDTLLRDEPLPLNKTAFHELFDPNLDKIQIQETTLGIDLIGSQCCPEAAETQATPLAQLQYPIRHLKPLIENYDYIVIDCPPSIGPHLTLARSLTDYLVVPVRLSGHLVKSLQTLYVFLETTPEITTKICPVGIAINEYQDTATQRSLLTTLEETFPEAIFRQKIRYHSTIDLASRGDPICQIDNGKAAEKELYALFREILRKLPSSLCEGFVGSVLYK